LSYIKKKRTHTWSILHKNETNQITK